jgi:hypothetical protein
MSNKNYYYNKNGEAIEIFKSSKIFVNRNQKEKPTMLKIDNTKKKNEKTKR